jgi:protein disulfide-isomerase-like protein
MNFFNDTQRLVLAIAVITLIIAVVIYLRRSESTPSIQIESMATENGAVEDATSITDLQEPQQNHQKIPIHSDKALVMFFAPWCGHCKSTGPIFDELKQNFDGYNGVKIIKINGDEDPQICQRHAVRGFPTIKLCTKGLDDAEGIVYDGDRSIQSLAEFLQQHA